MLGLNLSLPRVAVRGGGGNRAALDLDFTSMTADTLDSRIAFSRSSLAWQYDSTGRVVTVPHNLLPNSQDIEATGWAKTGGAVTANVVVSPDGTTTGDLLTEDTSTGEHRMSQTPTSNLNVAHTLSVYVKAGTGTRGVRLLLANNAVQTNVVNVRFDASGGVFTFGATQTGGTGSVVGTSVTSVGGGWYRLSLTGIADSGTGSGTLLARINMMSTTANSYTGDSSSLYFWGAQLAQSSTLRPYLNTSVRNLLGYSEQFDNAAWTKTLSSISANAVVSPDGTLTADKLVEDTTATAQHYARQAVAVVAGTTYTQSVYVKAGERFRFRMEMASAQFSANERAIYDLSLGTVASNSGGSPTITPIGNGWFRLSLTGTCTTSGSPVFVFMLMPDSGTASTYTGNGTSGLYVWGAQLSSSGSLDTYSVNTAAAPTSAAYHGPAFDYDPSTLATRGLRIAEARTNPLPGTMTGGTYWSSIGT